MQTGTSGNENAVILPAREGTLRVLRAARDAGVRRVALTSAFHAIDWGHPHRDQAFTENDRILLDGPASMRTPKARPSPSVTRGISRPPRNPAWNW
ncbi:hypothetical protein [Micromonospora sp. LOL_021]|uniref:hypothetical protein n=1 Tax=Micromonospora sp. LOL_021 TaxID=3345417 RepID=UPI003A839877